MKKLKLLFLVVPFVVAACHSDNEEGRISVNQLGSISFQVVNDEVYEYGELTRGSVTSLKHLDMAIYDAESNELVDHVHKGYDEEGYGQFSAVLPFGSYNIVFLGYEGSRQANVESPTGICFPDDYVPHLYYKTLPLTIDRNETNTQSVVLKRCVAGFELRSKDDKIPQDLYYITISGEGGGHHLNALTGRASRVEDRSYTYTAATYAGGDTMVVRFYTFLTAEEATMNFKVSAFDESKEKELRTRTFENVPMKISQKSTYTGKFFAPDQSTTGFQIAIEDMDWTVKEFFY